MILAEKLMRNGIDPKALKSRSKLKTYFKQIENAIKKTEDTKSGIRNTESAKVFDLEGKEIENTNLTLWVVKQN